MCPYVLTIGMPKLRHKCHFWWSLWVFFREDQMRFEIASLAKVKRKKEIKLSTSIGPMRKNKLFTYR